MKLILCRNLLCRLLLFSLCEIEYFMIEFWVFITIMVPHALPAFNIGSYGGPENPLLLIISSSCQLNRDGIYTKLQILIPFSTTPCRNKGQNKTESLEFFRNKLSMNSSNLKTKNCCQKDLIPRISWVEGQCANLYTIEPSVILRDITSNDHSFSSPIVYTDTIHYVIFFIDTWTMLDTANLIH